MRGERSEGAADKIERDLYLGKVKMKSSQNLLFIPCIHILDVQKFLFNEILIFLIYFRRTFPCTQSGRLYSLY